MTEEKKFGSIKRFGPRYGLKIKKRVADIEKNQRKKQKCPYCNKVSVKRVASGIWECRVCMAKFTGDAYFIEKKIVPTEGAEESEIAKV